MTSQGASKSKDAKSGTAALKRHKYRSFVTACNAGSAAAAGLRRPQKSFRHARREAGDEKEISPSYSRRWGLKVADGRITSNGGVMILAAAERKLGVAEKLAAIICDPRDPLRVVHLLPDILRASDRTSCRSPLAHQMRLILHTGAYWLMLTMRDAIPNAHSLAKAEFATIRLRLLKLGARVIETVSRVRLAFAAACSDAGLIRQLATRIVPAMTTRAVSALSNQSDQPSARSQSLVANAAWLSLRMIGSDAPRSRKTANRVGASKTASPCS
jgi:Transposase DDE domain group 1